MYIRKSEMADLPALTKFYDQVVDYLYENVNYPRWEKGVYPCEESIKQRIQKGEQFIGCIGPFVAGAFVINEDPVGDYSVGEWKQNLKEGEYLIIHTLAVHYSFYGKGFATEMVNFAKKLAKELGYKAVRIDVVPDNYPARRLYESLGFSYAGNKDLSRNFEHIPTFCLYEFDLTKEKTVFD